MNNRSVTQPRATRPTFVDDLEAARLALLADAAFNTLPLLREAVDAIVRASYEKPLQARVQARRLLAKVLTDLLHVQLGLAQPVPPFRKSTTSPVHVVRHSIADLEFAGVADLEPVKLPAGVSL